MDPFLALLIAALVVGALYVSASRNPLTKCRKCGGGGKVRAWLLPWRYRPCSRCKRAGEVYGRFGNKS